MELSEYAMLASETDQTLDDDDGLMIALLGLAGESGSVVAEAKKWLRSGRTHHGLRDRSGEELGDLLWYVAAVARHLGLDLDEVARGNLDKVRDVWSKVLPPAPKYDQGWPEHQSFPRQMRVHFQEDAGATPRIVRVVPLGNLACRMRALERRLVGAPLDDNSYLDDGYRFHDILHLAHATVLGWSPVLRSLIGAKRKDEDRPDVDRIEDGARAVAIEEGLVATVFSQVEAHGFLEGADRVEWDLLKHVKYMVRGLEVSTQPATAWQHTYLEAFAVLRQLLEERGGVVHCDLDERRLTFVGKGPMDELP